ncbi:MAG: hypothetical protein HYT03_00745 [Candidatus Harrisonbacteria bacterium]|nr:hypothetical protein [Candidatus Harrisonbacteria bacterium]
MRNLPVVFFCFLFSAVARAQDWKISGDLKIERFVINNEPEYIRLVYKNHDESADYRVALDADVKFTDWLKLNLEPYIWASNDNKVSRAGAFAILDLAVIETWSVGLGHHSWHNADKRTPADDLMTKGENGRFQDWLFAEWRCAKLGVEKFGIDLAFGSKLFLNNTDPIEVKDRYFPRGYFIGGEDTANYEFSCEAKFRCGDFRLDLEPYVQISSENRRLGLRAEATYPLWNQVALLSTLNYYQQVEEESRLMIGIGLSISLK